MMRLVPLCILATATAAAVARTAAAAGAPVHPLRAPTAMFQATPRAADPADSLWRAARSALDDREYRRASDLFKQYVARYPKADRAADAYYWRAWSLFQIGSQSRSRADLDAALAAADTVAFNYGKGTELAHDVTDLHARIRAAQAALGDASAAGDIATQAKKLQESRSCSSGDDEVRMAALQGLVNMNSGDALPILKQVLAQRDPCRIQLRKNAVYLLSTQRGADAVGTLVDVARNDPSREVQSDAVYFLSTTKSDRATAALDSILFSSADNDLRRNAAYALSVVGSERAAQALRRAAQSDQIPDDVRSQVIYHLGVARMADLAFFRTLYKDSHNRSVRDNIIASVVNLRTPEATQWLIDMAKDKSIDADSRKNAIYWAGQQKTVDMDQLNQIYDQARGDDDVQKQVLFVYSTRHEPAAVDKLMAIAKSDPSIEMKKQALYWLGTKNDPRVKQFILDLLK